MFLGKSLYLFVGILFGSLDLDLRGQIQILCLDILKRDGFGFEASKYLDFKASHVLLQGSTLFYVLKLKPPSLPGFASLNSSCPFKRLYLSLPSIENLNHKILIGLSRFIYASVGSIWFVCGFWLICFLFFVGLYLLVRMGIGLV